MLVGVLAQHQEIKEKKMSITRRFANLGNALDSASTSHFLSVLNKEGLFRSVLWTEIAERPNVLDSADVSSIIVADVDKAFVDSLGVDAATLDGQGPGYYLSYDNLIGTPEAPVEGTVSPTITTDTISGIVDSDYVQRRQSGAGFSLYEYTATDGQTTFADSDIKGAVLAYADGYVLVHYNGVLLSTTEYTATNGDDVILQDAADSGATSGALNGVTIGATTPATGSFTTVSATGTPSNVNDLTNKGYVDSNSIARVFRRMQRELRKMNINFVFRKGNTLYNEICKLKLPRPRDESKNVVYVIKCRTCDTPYIGESCQTFKARRSQHKSDVRRRVKTNGIYQHLKANRRHKIDWEDASFLDKEEHWHTRKLKESLYINAMNPAKEISEVMNLDKGYALNQCWDKFLSEIRGAMRV